MGIWGWHIKRSSKFPLSRCLLGQGLTVQGKGKNDFFFRLESNHSVLRLDAQPYPPRRRPRQSREEAPGLGMEFLGQPAFSGVCV